MSRKTFAIIISLFLVIVGWSQHYALKAYVNLLLFHVKNLGMEENSLCLRQAINAAQNAHWVYVDSDVIERFKPQGTLTIKTELQRSASFPSGQILLEFLTVDRDDKSMTGLADYLDVVYVQKNWGGDYQKIGTFRKFLP